VRHGFKRIVIIPSHGGNFGPIAEVKDDLQEAHPDVKIITYTDLQAFVAILQETSRKLGVTAEESGAHAGEAEVSMILWAREDLVMKENMMDATGFMGAFTEKETQKIFAEGIGALSPIGVLGCPKKARKEHGIQYIDDLAKALTEYINQQ
jgi:creatinine amidohydrolase